MSSNWYDNMNSNWYDVMSTLVQSGKCWTDKTFQTRESLIQRQLVTKSELMQQCDSRWELYDTLLSSKSWQMLDVQIAAFGASTAFTAVDWLVLFVGFGTVKSYKVDGMLNILPIFEQDVIFKGIDESSLFDDALHNTRILKFMFQSTSALYSSYTITYAMRLCAHAFAKFPQLENHSANFGRNRNIGRFQRVTYSKAKAFL